MKLQNIEAQEFRFQQIVTFSKKGFKQSEIAELVSCSQTWVSKVLQRARVGGEENLRAKKAGHPKPAALTTENLQEIDQIIEVQSPTAYGFETEGWTRAKVAEVIFRRFGVRHDVSHISRLMKNLGFSLQKPQRVDYRQSTEAIEGWREERLPQLKKSD